MLLSVKSQFLSQRVELCKKRYARMISCAVLCLSIRFLCCKICCYEIFRGFAFFVFCMFLGCCRYSALQLLFAARAFYCFLQVFPSRQSGAMPSTPFSASQWPFDEVVRIMVLTALALAMKIPCEFHSFVVEHYYAKESKEEDEHAKDEKDPETGRVFVRSPLWPRLSRDCMSLTEHRAHEVISVLLPGAIFAAGLLQPRYPAAKKAFGLGVIAAMSGVCSYATRFAFSRPIGRFLQRKLRRFRLIIRAAATGQSVAVSVAETFHLPSLGSHCCSFGCVVIAHCMLQAWISCPLNKTACITSLTAASAWRWPHRARTRSHMRGKLEHTASTHNHGR